MIDKSIATAVYIVVVDITQQLFPVKLIAFYSWNNWENITSELDTRYLLVSKSGRGMNVTSKRVS